MAGQVDLPRLEAVVDRSGVSEAIEALLPRGVRPRQLSVRTLLCGLLATLADGRPAHLTWVHKTLVSLADEDRWRLGVVANWKTGPHLLTYRQCERTFGLTVASLARSEPDGTPSDALSSVVDALCEASIPATWQDTSHSLAIDWSDIGTFSAPPPMKGGTCD